MAAHFPGDVQVAAVRDKLAELNPDFDPADLRIGYDPVRGTVRELFLPTDLVSDIPSARGSLRPEGTRVLWVHARNGPASRPFRSQ